MPIITKKCKICKKDFSGERWYIKRTTMCSRSCQSKWLWMTGKVKHRTGYHLTEETRLKISNSLKGEKHFNWKEKPTYGIVHYWLRTNYGNANRCEGPKCNGKSKVFEWSLIKGKSYVRSRENFWQLCRSCHTKYDKQKSQNFSNNSDNPSRGIKDIT